MNLSKDEKLQMLKSEFENGLTYIMVLNITEDCNFRCKYCYLSEVYDYTRNRTSEKMTFETAKRSIEYFFSYLSSVKKRIPNKAAGITIYGGEPLLEFKLVKQIVKFIKENAPVPIMINMTTNGYLLNDEVADFVVSNDIHIAVSFDGSKNNHDRNRTLENNVGTYERVLSNIKQFVRRHPSYSNIGIVSVYDIKTDLLANEEIFNDMELPRIFFLNEVSSTMTCYYAQFNKDDYEKYNFAYDQMLNRYISSKCNNTTISSFTYTLFESRLMPLILRMRRFDSKSALVPFTGTCVPGMKINVRVDGTFDMCERINQTFPIGDILSGIDYERIVEITEMYNNTTWVST